MGRRKQSKVDKSPFKLRRRKLSDGRESLFIDRTVDGKHEYEFLKLYLVPETSVKAKRENAKTLRQAEEIILAKTEDMVDDKAREEAAKDAAVRFYRLADGGIQATGAAFISAFKGITYQVREVLSRCKAL